MHFRWETHTHKMEQLTTGWEIKNKNRTKQKSASRVWTYGGGWIRFAFTWCLGECVKLHSHQNGMCEWVWVSLVATVFIIESFAMHLRCGSNQNAISNALSLSLTRLLLLLLDLYVCSDRVFSKFPIFSISVNAFGIVQHSHCMCTIERCSP